MNQETLLNLQKQFGEYAESFFGDDKFINFNLHLKLCHSYKVRGECKYIAEGLGLNKEQICLSEAVGILHDIGRFKQFVKYQTYRDVISVNHGLMGLEELENNGFFDAVDSNEQEIIRKAVEFHGAKEIPSDFSGEILLQTQIIRDADKIDIYRVVVAGYRLYRNDREHYLYDLEYPENGEYSREIVDAVLNGEKIDYKLINSMDDARLVQLGWVYDINFKPSVERIMQKGYLEQILDFMPETSDIHQIRESLFHYIENRLKD